MTRLGFPTASIVAFAALGAAAASAYDRQLASRLDPVTASTGTAFVVHSDGYLITNAHVLEDTESVRVGILGAWHDARVVGRIYNRNGEDLALLQINRTGLTPLPFAISVTDGEDVWAFGYPHSDLLGLKVKITEGVVSAITAWPRASTPTLDRVQFDAGSNPGNSGGPLINSYGEVVGVVTSGYSSMQSIAFAQHIRMLRAFLQRNGVSWSAAGQRRERSGSELYEEVRLSVGFVHAPWNPALRLKTKGTHRVGAIDFSSDAEVVAAGHDDGTVTLWDVRNRIELDADSRMSLRSPITALAWSPTSRTLAVGNEAGKVWLWNVTTQTTQVLKEFGLSVTGLAFSPDGSRVVAAGGAGSGGVLRAWDIRGNPPRDVVDAGMMGGVASFSLSPDGKRIALVLQEGVSDGRTAWLRPRAVMYDWFDWLESSRELGFLELYTGPSMKHEDRYQKSYYRIRFSRDGRRVIVATPSGGLLTFDSRTGKRVIRPTDLASSRVVGPGSYRPSLAIPPGSDIGVLTLFHDGSGAGSLPPHDVELVDAQTGFSIGSIGPLSSLWGPTASQVSSNGRLLAIGNEGGELRVFLLSTLRHRVRPSR